MSRNSSRGPAGPGARCTPGGGEEGHGAVAPVVHQARRRVLRVELKDRQELHRGYPEVRQVGNLRAQAGIGAARRRRHPGAGVPREADDVQLIDHGLRERALQRRIPCQSYACGSATALFMATAVFAPGCWAARRL